MNKSILWPCILALVATALIAQEQKSSVYSFTLEQSGKQVMAVSAIFYGRTPEEVWSATIKMLIMDGKAFYEIVTADRINGFIAAKSSVMSSDCPQYFFGHTPDGATVFFPFRGRGAAMQKYAEDICKRIAEQLPPKVR